MDKKDGAKDTSGTMKTTVLKAAKDNYDEVVARTGEMLREGRIVSFPTETVYGIGGDLNNKATLERLIRLKNRPPNKPFTIHIADQADFLKYSPGPNLFARKLIDRYWPGPLTLIVKSLQYDWIGLRLPGLELARDIIRASGVSVALPSANPAGLPPALNGQEVLDYYGDQIELVVDSGNTTIGDPSTVIKLEDDSFDILRSGIITDEDIVNTVCRKILFVCSGNTCRSPIAESFLKHLLAERIGTTVPQLPNRGFLIQSAGIAAVAGEQPSRNAVKALAKWDIHIDSHRACNVTRSLIENSDLILVNTAAHKAALEAAYGVEEGKVELLNRNGEDIPDPFGASESCYARCASLIYSQILEIIEAL